jgi:hypothetical protein
VPPLENAFVAHAFFPQRCRGKTSAQRLTVDNPAYNSRAAKTSAPSFQLPLLAAIWRGFAHGPQPILRAMRLSLFDAIKNGRSSNAF